MLYFHKAGVTCATTGVMFSLANLSWWFGNILFAQLTPVLLASPLQTHGTFYLFATAQIVAFFYVLFLIPETKVGMKACQCVCSVCV